MLKEIVEYLIKNHITIATMESCTGGLLASLITDIPDASTILKFSAVTYSTEYKIKNLLVIQTKKKGLIFVFMIKDLINFIQLI